MIRQRENQGADGWISCILGDLATPGRYVGAEEAEDDDEPFEDKMKRLTAKLDEQFLQSAELERAVKANLRGLGYGS